MLSSPAHGADFATVSRLKGSSQGERRRFEQIVKVVSMPMCRETLVRSGGMIPSNMWPRKGFWQSLAMRRKKGLHKNRVLRYELISYGKKGGL